MYRTSSIHELCVNGDKDAVLKYGKKHGREGLVVKDDAYDQTPLHLAAENGHCDLIIILLEKFKVPVSPTDKNGWSPLHAAAAQGMLDACEILLDHGAFAPAQTSEGTTALHYLCRFDVALKKDKFRRVVQKMLQGGADLNAQNRNGVTPLHEASLRGNLSVVQVLLEFEDLALDATTSQGETGLIYAARCNHPKMIHLLLDAGASPIISGSEGTALDVAIAMNRREAAKELRARVRDPCKLCGKPFFPLCFHVAAPKIWDKFTDEQKAHRKMRLSADLCQVHDDVFVRGIIDIPILSSNATAEISATMMDVGRGNMQHPLRDVLQPGQLCMSFGVFVQVSKTSFDDYVKVWNTQGRELTMQPLDGFVANVLPYWESSLNIPCKLHVQKVGCRPLIEIVDVSHPLYTAQREGIPYSLTETIKGSF